MSDVIPLPPQRGPEYDRRLSSFLTKGEIYRMHSRFIIIRKLQRGMVSSYEYGLCCFGCGSVSWEYEDVEARYCPACRTVLTNAHLNSTG